MSALLIPNLTRRASVYLKGLDKQGWFSQAVLELSICSNVYLLHAWVSISGLNTYWGCWGKKTTTKKVYINLLWPFSTKSFLNYVDPGTKSGTRSFAHILSHLTTHYFPVFRQVSNLVHDVTYGL